ncbi:uncharacterized protein LOC143270431 [Peromyscus maniculatus bairdii]|uniref:uncharacterized protein LOC143270431 n=1 Tax=Peromyscus maniculatus bairdii TaxID=230844 RepID=UPI003FD494A9
MWRGRAGGAGDEVGGGTAPRPVTGHCRAHFHHGGVPRPSPGRLERPGLGKAPEQPLQREWEDEAPAPSPIAGSLRGKRDEPAKESRAFPLREGPNHQLQYWPFSASDLYNWKQHNPPFSKDPVALTNLIESILMTHKPTWEDCQQLLQTLLTVEEKQRVFLEAWKQVPGDDGRPTQLPNIIDAAFPLTRPNWDFATPEGREHLRLYHQLLLAGLRGAARCPANLAQVRNVIQGKEEMPAAFLERLREAYRMYTPYDLEDTGQAPGVILSFIYQSSPEIRAKLQRLVGLHSFSLSDLLREEEKVFNKRETPKERKERMWQRQEERDKKSNREISKVLATLKASATPVSIKQYSMSREAHEGIKPHIQRLLDQGVLVPCGSPWNTPLLPVKKPGTGDYRPVQDLREVNKWVEDIHPMVPNPYNLLSTLPPTHIWYMILDLKDAFFCLRLHPQSQLLLLNGETQRWDFQDS